MLLGGIQKYVILAIGMAFCMLLGVSYWYYSHSQQQIATLTENATKLEAAVKTQQEAIQAQQRALENQHRAMADLHTQMFRADAQRRDLEVQVRRWNLESRARQDHAQLTRRMNEATVRMFSELEQLTGGTPHVPAAPPSVTAPATPTSRATDPDHPQPPPAPPQRRSP